MKLYRYWAVDEKSIVAAGSRPLRLRKWGGSNISEAEALKEARRKLEELSSRLHLKDDLQSYLYSTRDLPEELVEEISPEAGITRNRLGVEVLNTSRMCMVDIDFTMPGFFARLFGRKTLDEKAHITFLKEWLAGQPADTGVRAYRTAAGLRYIFTHDQYPVDDRSLKLMKELRADPLYVRLCSVQQSYRARLTPKPWRLGFEGLHGFAFPRSAREEKDFREWLQGYEARSRNNSVCYLVGHFSNTRILPELRQIIDLHDARCGVDKALPLA